MLYGAAGIVTAILGQAGTSVRGAYDVLVSMALITLFIPYLFLFAALIRLVRRRAITQLPFPGGPPMAIALAILGFLSTVLTIVLSTIPAPDDANPPLAVAKILLSTLAVIIAGLAVFAIGRRRKIAH
jgi:amino acid transporter